MCRTIVCLIAVWLVMSFGVASAHEMPEKPPAIKGKVVGWCWSESTDELLVVYSSNNVMHEEYTLFPNVKDLSPVRCIIFYTALVILCWVSLKLVLSLIFEILRDSKERFIDERIEYKLQEQKEVVEKKAVPKRPKRKG